MTQSALIIDDPNETALFHKRMNERMLAHSKEKRAAADAGLPALMRLIAFADNDNAKADQVRRLLLSLYNGYRFPFHFRNLRFLDIDILNDCLAVIKYDAMVKAKEVHQFTDDGGKVWERWAKETELDEFSFQTK